MDLYSAAACRDTTPGRSFAVAVYIHYSKSDNSPQWIYRNISLLPLCQKRIFFLQIPLTEVKWYDIVFSKVSYR